MSITGRFSAGDLGAVMSVFPLVRDGLILTLSVFESGGYEMENGAYNPLYFARALPQKSTSNNYHCGKVANGGYGMSSIKSSKLANEFVTNR